MDITKTPIIISEELDKISTIIQNVEFIHSGFENSLNNVSEGDFVYMDPPYAPENSKSFVGYVADGFNIEMHNRLFDTIKKLINVKFIMSNAKVDLVLNHFTDYNCEDIIARRQ